jgi:hypothetical protein
MSRQLPAQPHLVHLKKQAKELLRDRQQQDPEFKLADALHALAREYGFDSWPKLKAHVESIPRGVEPSGEESPFAGTWTANLSRSQRHPLNQFRSATLQFTVTDDTVTITDIVVSDSGREERGENTLHVDGKECSADRNGYSLMATWRGSHVLETVAKKDGQLVGWGRYEVAPDGKSLTITADQQVIVLDRVWGLSP